MFLTFLKRFQLEEDAFKVKLRRNLRRTKKSLFFGQLILKETLLVRTVRALMTQEIMRSSDTQ